MRPREPAVDPPEFAPAAGVPDDLETDVLAAAHDRRLHLVDIRPAAERWGGLGLVPGTVSWEAADEATFDRLVASGRPLVLVCLSGHRSLDQTRRFAGRWDVRSLRGGVLGWAAHGLPLAAQSGALSAVPSDDTHAPDFAALCRSLTSCFVAEISEVALDVGAELDPMSLLQECFDAAGVHVDAPTPAALVRAVDEAAAASRRLGNAYARIAANIDQFMEALQAPDGPNRSLATAAVD